MRPTSGWKIYTCCVFKNVESNKDAKKRFQELVPSINKITEASSAKDRKALKRKTQDITCDEVCIIVVLIYTINC